MNGVHTILHKQRRRLVAALVVATVIFTAFFTTRFMSRADETVVIPLVAHRGFSEAYPENTLSAFAGAMAWDAKYIEFDVQMTKDGELVIFHDEDMARICNVDLSIPDYTYEELLSFDVGSYKGERFAKERIPTLEQTLDLLAADDSILIIEMKDKSGSPEFAQGVYFKVKQKNLLNRVVFASFNYDYLMVVKEMDPGVKTMYISTMSNPSIVETHPADYYNLNRKYLSAKTVKSIHSVDAACFAYTAKNEKQILNMQSIGVDGVVSDGLDY